ncbi:Uncharacterised protein [Providencia rustigianii]|nr:hypothetical protein [Providencia rustigianii]VEB62993.1 Uncharacterised protein [Providencia rustigianii]VEH52887.1 Uncharacterised protein [Providencia rustigianii]
MTRKVKVTFSAKQKLEYAKLMVEGGYSTISKLKKYLGQANLQYRDGSNNIWLS